MRITQQGDAPELFEFAPEVKGYPTRSRAAFSSLSAFANWLPGKRRWHNVQKETDEGANPDWTGHAKFDDAIRMATKGWPEGRNRATKLRDKINAANPMGPRMVRYDVAGDIPSIPRALAGNPMSMKRLDSARLRRRPIITLVSHAGATGGVDGPSFERRAAVCAAIVDSIESAGFSVALYTYTVSGNSSSNVAQELICRIKDAGEIVDMDIVSFAMGHPAFLRRMVFESRVVSPECEPIGTSMGQTQYNVKADNAADTYLLPAICADGFSEEMFSTDDAAIQRGLPAMIASLQKQGCPAFPETSN